MELVNQLQADVHGWAVRTTSKLSTPAIGLFVELPSPASRKQRKTSDHSIC